MQPNIESAAAQTGGYVNPFMVAYEAESALAYRDTKEKGLEGAVTAANEANKLLISAVKQGRTPDGSIDFDNITGFTGTKDEKAEAIVLANSRLHGMEKAVAELRKAQTEKDQAEKIMEMNGIDASLLPEDRRHLAHQVLPYSAEYAREVEAAHGFELGSSEFKSRVLEGQMMAFDLAKHPLTPRAGLNDRSRSIMATLFQTNSWEPNRIYEPGWLPSRGGGHVPVQVLDLLYSGPMGGKNISYWVETTYTNSAAERAEGGALAQSAYALSEMTVAPVSIGHHLPLTEEALEDRMELDDYIDYVMPLGVLQRIDQQVQIGDGASNNLRGILKHIGQADATRDIDRVKLPATALSGDDVDVNAIRNPWDVLLDLRLRGEDYGYGILGMQRPNVVVCHVDLWGAALKSKPGSGMTAGEQDTYYVGGPQGGNLFNTPWGMQLRVSSNTSKVKSGSTKATNNFIAYAFDNSPMFSKLYYRHGISVRFGLQNDDFTKLKVTVRAEARVQLALKRPKAFIGLANQQSASDVADDS